MPEWVHLVPTAQGEITTFDGRGPYRIEDAEAVIAASLSLERGLVIDEAHETDKGNPAPARGWITELQARADGIWGRVDWTGAGRALIADRAYRGISPNLLVDEKNVVRALARAALTNKPNLRGLTPVLQSETPMDMAKIAEALGLGADADQDAILAAIGKMKGKDKPAEAMQSALNELGATFGVEGADPTAILAAGKAAAANGALVATLQAENAGLKERLQTEETARKRAASEAFVDGEIARKRAIPAAERDFYVTLHMSQPDVAERVIGTIALLGETGASAAPPPVSEGGLQSELSAEQAVIADSLGIPRDKYLAQLNADLKETR